MMRVNRNRIGWGFTGIAPCLLKLGDKDGSTRSKVGDPVEIRRSFGGWRGERFVVPQDAHLSDAEAVTR